MNKITSLIKKTLQHELISGSFYVFVGFIFTSFFSFLINLFLARNLSYSNYGEYSSLLSIYTLATIPAGSLGIVVIRFAAQFFAKNEIDKLSAFYKKTLIFWAFVGTLIFTGYILLIPLISSFLKISDIFPIITIGIAISVSYLSISNTSFLQALTKFKLLSSVSASGAFVRLISGAVLVLNNFKVLGATFSILISTLVTFLLSIIPLRFLLIHKADMKVNLHIGEIVKYGFPASMSILFFSSFVSTDVILVKHFFNSIDAGYYGGLSLVGRVIFYFTGPIPMVMFPLLIRRQERGENTRNLLYLSLVLILIPSLIITGFYYLFPNFTINFFLAGRNYLNVASYLGIFGIFITIFSINNVFLSFFLSLKKTFVVYFIGLGALFQILLITFWHKNFTQVISSSIISSLFLFIILLLYYIRIYGFHNTEKQRPLEAH